MTDNIAGCTWVLCWLVPRMASYFFPSYSPISGQGPFLFLLGFTFLSSFSESTLQNWSRAKVRRQWEVPKTDRTGRKKRPKVIETVTKLKMTSFNRHQSTGTLLSGSLFDPMKASLWRYVWGERDIKEIIFTSQTSYFQSSVKVSYKIYICLKTECLLWIYQNAKDHVPVQLFANVWKAKALRRKNSVYMFFFVMRIARNFTSLACLTGWLSWNYFYYEKLFSQWMVDR